MCDNRFTPDSQHGFCAGGGVPRASTTMDLSVVAINCYRPQTKFAKVMFLQVSVCPRGEACGRGCA